VTVGSYSEDNFGKWFSVNIVFDPIDRTMEDIKPEYGIGLPRKQSFSNTDYMFLTHNWEVYSTA